MQQNNCNISQTARFDLPLDAIVHLDGRSCRVERRLNDQWWFLETATLQPRLENDISLARLQAEGRFHIEWQPHQKEVIPAAHPLNVGPAAYQESLRKLEYVEACLKDSGFLRSRRVAVPIIEAVAGRRGEKPPSFTAVLGWLDRHARHGGQYGAAALSNRHDRKGQYGHRLSDFQEEAIQAGIAVWLKRTTKVNAYATVCAEIARMEKERAIDKSSLSPEFLTAGGLLKPPSRRSFERRCDAVDPLVRNAMRVGPRYARQHGRTYSTLPLPEMPYSYVEVDHCTLDVLLMHPSGLILGRPDLVLFRDRATAMILGYGLGFDQPSYASFLEGLRQTIYPKDLARFPMVKSGWPAFGRIENLITDRGKHFVGDNIENAARELGITLIPMPPRTPWAKGAIERFFGTLNTGFLHQLPGTTLSNALERKDYEFLGGATLTVQQFEALLVYWICEIYNQQDTKALGFIRGFGNQSPIEAWNEKATRFVTGVLPDKSLFAALAGDVSHRTLQRNGFTLDHIVYEHPQLTRLLGNPKFHSSRKSQSVKYKIVRDPQDLGKIHVVDHLAGGDVLEVPACAAHISYANGLSLVEHQIVCAEARRREGSDISLSQVVQAKARLANITTTILATQKFKTVQRRMARWLEGDRLRAIRSEITTQLVSDADFIERISTPTDGISPTTSSASAGAPDAGEQMSSGSPQSKGCTEIDDLAELKARKKWNSEYE